MQENEYYMNIDNEEEWRDIPGYENLYRVSSLGRILSLGTGKIRKDVRSGLGYRAIQLSDFNRKKHRYYVHRLVAIAFLGSPPSEKYTVNHKNFDKTDNRAENLEWCTPQENMRHAYVNGRTDYHKTLRRDNTTGCKGVSPASGGFNVAICGRYIGWTKDLDKAIAMRKEAERRMEDE